MPTATKSLWRMYSKRLKGDHFFTTNAVERDLKTGDYPRSRLEGYVFPEPAKDLIPLHTDDGQMGYMARKPRPEARAPLFMLKHEKFGDLYTTDHELKYELMFAGWRNWGAIGWIKS